MLTEKPARLLVKGREFKMKLATKCISTSSLPYESAQAATKMMAKLFAKTPYLAMLPKISENDDILNLTLENLPGIKIKNKKVTLKTTSQNYKQQLEKLDKAYNSPNYEHLAPFAIKTEFFEKYLDIIKKFKSPNAFINMLGPFTISQMLRGVAEEQMLADKSYRKLFIQAVSVRALWIVEEIKKVSPKTQPIIILNEPILAQLGILKKMDDSITTEVVTALLSKVIEKLHEANVQVGIQCMEKCDWQIPINAGVDLISFDAYNNPNNLSVIPEQITEFLKKGGKINWAIVPTLNETLIKELSVDYLLKRLQFAMEELINAGVSQKLVYKTASVSLQGNTEHLSILFAEKALMLSTKLGEKLLLQV